MIFLYRFLINLLLIFSPFIILIKLFKNIKKKKIFLEYFFFFKKKN